MKMQFYLGMGLGAAAGCAAAMLMKPRKKDGKTEVKQALDSARQALDRTIRRIEG